MLKKEKQNERTHLLIVGLPRSGTSILASLVGAHSRVSIVCEDFGRIWTSVLGKPVVGNKLCVPRQISWHKHNSTIIKILKRFGLFKIWPKSHYSIQDYLQLPNLKIIVINRDLDDIRKSMVNRGELKWTGITGKVKSKKISERIIDYTVENGAKILDRLSNRKEVVSVEFDQLLYSPDSVLKEICSFIGVPFEEKMIDRGPQWNWMYPKESSQGLNVSKASENYKDK